MNDTDSRREDVRLIAFESASAADVRTQILKLGHTVSENQQQEIERDSRLSQLTVIVFESPITSRIMALRAITKAENQPVLGVFACTSCDWDEDLVDACTEFIGWPCNRKELSYRLERLANHARQDSGRRYAVDVSTEFAKHNLIGNSPAFHRVLRQLEKAARYDVPVLIEGQTGTGKEMIARALHYMGARAGKPFIPVNCGAVPDSLVENEFFGHEKGAYTGAGARQQGLIEQAQGGNLFLDEIGSLSPKAQVSLLRFLESHEFRPLGGRECQSADVRVIAASNTKLSNEVENGAFRQDLYFRLNILSLNLPPLAERDGDIDLLADFFMQRLISEFYQRKSLSQLARVRMMNHSWPGNVRELENLLRREYLLDDRTVMDLETLCRETDNIDDSATSSSRMDTTFNVARAQAVDAFERKYLCNLMRQAQGNVTQAALLAGKERRAMGKLLKKHGIDKSAYY